MNTAKQVNVMIGLLFVGLFGTLLYFLFDNGFNAFGINFEGREQAAVVRQERINVERGAHLYALNCRSCHGLTGQGPIERGGLPGAPLNVESVRPPALSASEVDVIGQRYNDTITCGRVGTLMPPWAIEQGGGLNFFQIEQLVMLITSEFAEEGWEYAVEEGNHADAFDPHKTLAEALSDSATTIAVNDASGLENTEWLRIGGDTIVEPYEVLEVVGVNEDDNTVVVVRGAQGSSAMEHEPGAEVYQGPLPAPDSPIIGDPESAGFPPCGQAAARPAATAGPPVQVSGDVEFVMGDNFFDYEGNVNPSLEVTSGDAVTFTLPNEGNAVHNLRLAGPDGEYDTDDDVVSDPDIIPGGFEGTLEFEAGEAASFPYRCDFHSVEMAGEITVVE